MDTMVSGSYAPTGERKLNISDFEILRLIGVGNFSEVFQVRRLLTQEDITVQSQRKSKNESLPTDGLINFAMKKVNKMRLKQLHKEAEVLMEKHCLIKLNKKVEENCCLGQQNIVKLYWTFQDTTSLYLVMEFCPEGELWDIISGVGILDDLLAKYYIHQVINAMEFVHSRHIVHRDLKAENILIQKDGTLKLIDFGTAVDLEFPNLKVAGNKSPGMKGRVYENFAGTAQFMAPEGLKNINTGRLCDLWSLGCTIYQILAGCPPFDAPSDFLVHLLSTNLDLDFPTHFPQLAIDLVFSLLKLDPAERLGAQKGFNEIRGHPYFDLTFEEVKRLIKDRYPPLHDTCFSHMSKNWDRFKIKWVESGWLLEDGKLPSVKANATQTSATFLDDKESSQLNHYWRKSAPCVGLECKSRELLQWSGAKECPHIRKGKERLLSIKKLADPNGTRNQEYWDSKVKVFLDQKRNAIAKTSESSTPVAEDRA